MVDCPTMKPTTPCREFRGTRLPSGYGRFTTGGRQWYLHRWIVAQIDGEEAIEGKVVMHHCDNPACFRYDHLRIGTQAENLADMVEKGRHNPVSMPGDENPSAKLTDEQVREIKERATNEYGSKVALAREFGVSPAAISKIVHGRTWAHVE